MEKLTDAERLRISRIIKREQKREYFQQYYQKRKAEISEKQKERRKQKRALKEQSLTEKQRKRRLEYNKTKAKKLQKEREAALEEERKHAQLENKRLQQRMRKRKQRAKIFSSADLTPAQSTSYPNRTAKMRAVKTTKGTLPKTPSKRAAVLRTIIESPTTRSSLEKAGVLTTPEEEDEARVAMAAMRDAKEALNQVKRKRSNDSRAAAQVGLTFLVGENVTNGRMKSKVAKTLNVNRKRVRKASTLRNRFLKSEKSCWTYTDRKTRSDAISTEHRKLAHDFWSSPEISRTMPDKKHFVKKRLAPKTWVTHQRHILEKTQTEAFLEFKKKFPNVKMGQRAFEHCKPFYVSAPKSQDRVTCCCRSHVETRMVFQSCMEYRRKVSATPRQQAVRLYEHLTDIVEDTLCPKEEDREYHARTCLLRECQACGVQKLNLLAEEMDMSEQAPKVKWQKFEYVNVGTTEDGKAKKRLQLVDKVTSPGEMFNCLKVLLATFVPHQFRANWQHQQLRELKQHLPLKHVLVIHDYSENYNCQQQDQLQSLYFAQTQASIHVTILLRHALQEIDGEDSTAEMPVIIHEHIFVISPDTKHDHHSVHQARQFIDGYLKQIGYEVMVMHEWTDGCSVQYKSRHCMGDVAHSSGDFGYITIRNYFETSHAKGPQDGAGANLKHRADMAVIKRQLVIRNAKELYTFAQREMVSPAPSRYQSENVCLKRRIFFYADKVNRDRAGRNFGEIKGNRGIHSIMSGDGGCTLDTRTLTCYCEECLQGNYGACANELYVEKWESRELVIRNDNRRTSTTRTQAADRLSAIKELVTKNAVVAIAAADAGQEYYLMQVTGDGPEIIQAVTRDDWGMRFPPGAEVFRGYFLVKSNNASDLHKFSLNRERVACVYTATVRFICPQFSADGDGEYRLSEALHLDILNSLDGF